MAKNDDFQLIKKAHTKDAYTKEQLTDLVKCSDDPIYFIEKFIKVQHSTKGSIPLILYDFQKRMIAAYHEHRFSIALTARQMGKCVSGETLVTKDQKQVQISTLLKLSPKEKLIEWLERRAIKISCNLK